MAEVGLEDLRDVIVSARKFEEGALLLTPVEGEEMTVVCDCGRNHWLVTTCRQADRSILKLVCHNCRRHVELPYSGRLE